MDDNYAKELRLSLIRADKEEEVIQLLRDAGYWDIQRQPPLAYHFTLGAHDLHRTFPPARPLGPRLRNRQSG